MDSDPPVNSPDPNASVWPPPPLNQGFAPQALTFPFKTLFFYVKPSSVPLFRQGMLVLYPEGIAVQGKVVTRYEIQAPILAVTLFLRLFLVAYLLMEYAIRRDDAVNIPWSDVRSVTLVPKKRRVCLLYDAPNYKGIVKAFSLTFRPDPLQYEAFVGGVQNFIPDRVAEGKLRPWTSPPVWIFCAGLLLSLTFLGILYAVSPQSLGNLH